MDKREDPGQYYPGGKIIPTRPIPVPPGGSVSPYDDNPEADGTASPGASDLYARGDHVHPTDETRAPAEHTHAKSEITDFPTAMAPTAHASTHAAGGSDAIAPSAIGAVAAVPGKGLSTNDYTTAEKQKLAGIEAGAEVNPTPVAPSTEIADGAFADAAKTAAFVNSSINAMAAFYITKNAAGDAFATKAELTAAIASGTFYNGGELRTPTKNDYLYVLADESATPIIPGVAPTTRYSFDGAQWAFQIVVNNTALTSAQVAAINSGATAALVTWLLAFKGSDTSTTLASVLAALAGKVGAASFQLPLKHTSASPSESGTAELTFVIEGDYVPLSRFTDAPSRPFHFTNDSIVYDSEKFWDTPVFGIGGYAYFGVDGWWLMDGSQKVEKIDDITTVEFNSSDSILFNYRSEGYMTETTIRFNWTEDAISEKTEVLTDAAPTTGSGNLLTSGAIKTALDGKLDKSGGEMTVPLYQGHKIKFIGNTGGSEEGVAIVNSNGHIVALIGIMFGQVVVVSPNFFGGAFDGTKYSIQGGYTTLEAGKITHAGRTFYLPYESGTFALLNDILALCQPFSATKVGGYAVGEFCSHLDGDTLKLYQCTTAHTGAWNAAHFDSRDVASLFSTVDSSTDPQPSGLLNNSALDKAIVKVASTVSPTDVAKSGAVALAFDESKTYALDELVMHEGLLYRCTTAITTAGAWDATKWTAFTATDSDTAFLKDAQGHLVVKETAGQKNTLYIDAYRMASATAAGTKAIKDASVTDLGTIAANDVLTLPPAISGYLRDCIIIMQTPATLPTFTFPLASTDLEPWSEAIPTWAASTVYRITMTETRAGKWEIHVASKGVTA